VFVGSSGGARANPPLAATHSLAAGRALVTPAAAARQAGIQTGARPLAVGASVMLSARAALGDHATVDAAVGRQAPDILARLQRYRRAGRLPGRVVVQIGENGPIFGADIRQLKRELAGVDRVVLVNVRVMRSWRSEVNAVLAETVHDWKQARLADWYTASENPALIYDDGTHPTPPGRNVYARVVERALR